MMKKVMSFLILVAAWGQAALPARADESFLGGFVSAVSAESAAARLEARSMVLVAPRVVSGTQSLVSSNGLTTTAWDTTALANGWHEVTEPTGGDKASLLVANAPAFAVEGGRLETSVTWDADAVHWVRNKVIVPRGVTLTVAAGAVVKFGEQTGMFVEEGGTVKFNGNSSAQVVLTSFADDVYGGDSDFGATNAVWNSWSLTAQSGGTINDLYTEVRYGTVGSLPTLSMPGAVTASRTTGKARVSVSFDTAPTKRAALTWRTVDGTAKYGVDFTQNSGTAVWVSGTTVYFDIPLVNLEDVQEVRTFTIELVTVEGANANPSRLKTTVSITGGDGAVEVPTCAESEESEAIRLETRDPDPKPEPVPATLAIEGGRLPSNAIWDSAATNFVLNTVVIPSGVTLTVVTNAVVYFTPNTGIKVEPGGALRVVGSAEGPALFTAATKGDWSLAVVSGGTFTDSYAIFEKTTISQHPTVTVPNGVEVSEKDGEVRVPVAVSGDRSSAFRVKWRAVDGTAKFGEDYTLASGEVEWTGTSQGTKYITIPISNDDVEEESETFSVELFDAQGANIGGSYRCTVLVRDGTAALVPLATCVESEESAAIRLETRDPDPKPEPVPASTAIEGGRLLSNVTWDSSATNFVLNTVVIPSGVTLTVVTNAYVHFTPNTGIKVEPGGVLRCIGSQDGPVVFAAANDGDYTINVVSGGTFTDTWTAFRNLNYGGFGTASLDGSLVVDSDEGVMRIPVYISGSRTSTFSVDWEGSDGTTGTIVWNNANEGKKWIELPIEGRTEGFSLRLVEGRGINISGTAHEIAVKVFTSAAPKAVCAESAESEAVRLENRADGTLARALVFGTEYVAADGETRAVKWDSTQVADGWQANGTLVRNSQSLAIECGRLQSNVTWSNDVTHLVRSWVIVPSGVTLTIAAGTVVKFCELTGFKVEQGGKLIVAGTEESPVVYTAAADDTIGGDSDLREATPNDGDYGVNIVSGGTYTDSNCAVRYTTFSNLGTATMTANALAALTDGIVRIPVTISTDRTTKFCVDWRTGGSRSCATASGRLTWNSKNDGTKYIELPLVSGSLTNEFDTFTVELYESQGINISTTARRCGVTTYSNDRFLQGAYAESGESDVVRFEAREYNSDLEIEASELIAIEGGRLQTNTTWSNNVTHLVRQWVVVPSGVTLTIQAGTVVKFLPYTGIKVEPGGRVNANGTAANNIVFTSVADDTVGGDTDGKEAVPQNGNYSISVISGGAFSTSETQLRYGTSGTFGSLYIMENAVAKKDDGWVKIPVGVSATSSEAFSVDWYTEGSRSCAAASGRLDWPANSTATKYIEIPLDRMAEAVEDETFTVTLTFTRGINLNQSRKTCLVTLYDTVNALKGVHVGHAESGWAELHRVDNIANTTWPIFAHEEESIAYSTRWVGSNKTPANVQVTIEAPDGQKETVLEEAGQSEGVMAWNTDGLPFGRYTLQHRVTDAEGGQLELLAHDFIVSDAEIHDGAVASNETWSASRVHVVRGDISVKNGVTLTIEAGAIVKFIPGTGLATEGTGECIANGVTFTHIADDQMGGDTLYDGGLMTPELGAFWFAGNITTDAETEFRYATAKEISANITADTVWDSHTVYHVTKSIQVRSPATLTIRKGAVVKFADRVALTVNSGATLNAQGTRAAPVVFTSIKDDTAGGDSNGDGDATEPVNGIWDEICNNGTMNLSYAVVRYGGYGQYSNQGDAAIRNGGGTAILNGCTIEGSDLRLLNCTGGKMDVSNTILRDGRWGLVGGNVSFVNGIIADCTTGANGGTAINTIFYGCPTAASGTTVKNSIAFECDAGTNGMTVADPLFDEEKGGWRIQKNSPCIDAGDETTAPAVDYFGQTRIGLPDVGLHEAPIRPVPSDIDLVAVSISASPSAVIGKTLEVTWTVENIGTENVGDSWRDVIEFIDEDGVTVELGRLTVSDGLMAGGRLTKRASFRVPSVNPGNVRLRLKVNAERDVPEGSQTGNNVIYAETTIAVVLPSIADDDYSRVTLAGGGSTAVRIPAGSGVSAIRLNGGENISAYAGAGYVPVALRYDVATFALSDGSYLLVLPKNADEKDFNITLQNTGNASETVNLETLAGEVSVLDVFPSEMSNTGVGYLTLYGIGMDRVTGVKIEGVSTRTANDVKVVSPGELTATVDMVDATEGNYSIVLETENDGTVRTAATIAVYRPKKGPKLEARLEIPDTVRQGRIYTGKIIYSNVGDAEMLAPFMRVVATDAGLRNLGSEDFVSSELAVMGIAPSYPAGIILPGETCEYEFEFKSGAAPRFMLHVEKDDTEKWEELSPRLSEAATILNQRGRAVYDFSTILDYAELCKTGTAVRAISGIVASKIDGVPLSGGVVIAMEEVDGDVVYHSGRSDESGVFVIENLNANNKYSLGVRSDGISEEVEIRLENVDINNVMLYAMPSRRLKVSLLGIPDGTTNAVSICVKDEANSIIATISTLENFVEIPVVVESSSEYLTIEATIGGYYASKDYAMVEIDNPIIESSVDFELSTILNGVVCNNASVPISNADVTVRSVDGFSTYNVITDSQGRFTVAGLLHDSYIISVSCFGFESFTQGLDVSEDSGDTMDFLVEMKEVECYTVSGTYGQDEDGLSVVLLDKMGKVAGSASLEDGTFSISSVVPGAYTLLILDDTLSQRTSPRSISVIAGNVNVDVPSAVYRNVTGMITSDSELVNAECTIVDAFGYSKSVAVDMTGSFNVQLMDGLYWVYASSDGCETSAGMLSVPQTTNFSLVLSQSGYVTWGDGTDVIPDRVYILKNGKWCDDIAGTNLVSGALPVGTYRVIAQYADCVFAEANDVSVLAGTTNRVTFVPCSRQLNVSVSAPTDIVNRMKLVGVNSESGLSAFIPWRANLRLLCFPTDIGRLTVTIFDAEYNELGTKTFNAGENNLAMNLGTVVSVSGIVSSNKNVSFSLVNWNGVSVSAYADEGMFSCDTVPADYNRIRVAYGAGCIDLPRGEFEGNGNVVDFDSRLPAETKIKVSVSREDDTPVRDMSIMLTDGATQLYSDTGIDGVATFRVPSGEWNVMIHLPNGEKEVQSVIVASNGGTFAFDLESMGWVNPLVSGRARLQSERLMGSKSNSDHYDWSARTDTAHWSVGKMRDSLKKYQDALDRLVKLEPVYRCEHNLKIYNDYKIARLWLSLEISQADSYVYSIHTGNVDIGFSIAQGVAHTFAQGWDDVANAINDLIREGFSWDDINTVYNQIMGLYDEFVNSECTELNELEAQHHEFSEKVKKTEVDFHTQETAYSKSKSKLDKARKELEKFEKKIGNKPMNGLDELAYEQKLQNVKNAEQNLKTAESKLNNAKKAFENAKKGKADVVKKISEAKKSWSYKFSETVRKKFKVGKWGRIAGKLLSALMNALAISDAINNTADVIFTGYEKTQDLNYRRRYFGNMYLPALEAAYKNFIAAYNKSYHLDCGTGEYAFTQQITNNGTAEIRPYVPPTRDPNEVAGPLGVGEQRFVKPGQEMEYFVYFENAEDVDGTVLDIRVTNPLSEWLDWSTFKMGEMVFNNQVDHSLEGLQNGTKEVPQKGTSYFVVNSVALDKTKGVVTVELHILDKTTKYGQPEDPYAGILPPNDETGRGEGHFSYKIKVRDDAPTGIVITNSATIYFDYNAPIETDPAWSNTVAQVVSVTISDGEGGSSTQDLIVGMPYGDTLPESPTNGKTGYTFAGWRTGPNGTGRLITAGSLVEAGDGGIYADWTANTYEVVFHGNGGEGEMPTQTNTYDAASSLASNTFTFARYRFAGWATNETGEVQYEDGATVSNLTAVAYGTFDLFAAWEPLEIRTPVEIDGVTTNLTLIVGEPFGELPTPAPRPGYSFGGWYTGPNGTGIRVTPDTPVPDGLTALYAYWIAGESEYAAPTLHDAPAYGGIGSAYKGGTFNGYAKDADGNIAGTFTLAVKKPAKGKTTAAATLTFVSLANGKKTKIAGTVDLATGAGSGGLAGLTLGADAVGGTVAKAGALEGGADAVKAKDKAALGVLAKFTGKSYVIVLEGSDVPAQGGFSTLAISMAAKGKAKVSGVLADGTKVTASGVMTVGDAYCCVPVIYSKKSKFGFVAWFDKNTRQLVDVTALTPWKNTVKPAFTMDWAVAASGAKGSLAAGTRTVALDGAKLSMLVPDAIEQTPVEIPLTVKGAKWDAGKAAKVAYKGGVVSVAGANVSGLKLAFTAKTGTFKGSFTVYSVKGGKLVKTKFTVNGAVVDGVAYGAAFNKKAGSVPVEIE